MGVKDYDNEIYTLLNKELERQCDHLEMIASENSMESPKETKNRISR